MVVNDFHVQLCRKIRELKEGFKNGKNNIVTQMRMFIDCGIGTKIWPWILTFSITKSLEKFRIFLNKQNKITTYMYFLF